MSDHDIMYKAAIALNNTGIYLIQRGQYIDAIATLKDAMSCTKQFCNGAILPCVMQKSDCAQMLQKARTRKSTCRVQMKESTTIDTMHCNTILVVSDQDNPFNVYCLLQQNHSAFCCVTIDPVERFNIDDIDRLQLESALIVYNFGIAYRCLANRPTVCSSFKYNEDSDDASHHDAFWASVRILDLTRSVTRNLLYLSSYSRACVLLCMPSSLLLTAIVVTTNLQQISMGHPMLNESEIMYNDDLLSIMAIVYDRERFLLAEGYIISVAIAA
jgi:hypothetical protein